MLLGQAAAAELLSFVAHGWIERQPCLDGRAARRRDCSRSTHEGRIGREAHGFERSEFQARLAIWFDRWCNTLSRIANDVARTVLGCARWNVKIRTDILAWRYMQFASWCLIGACARRL